MNFIQLICEKLEMIGSDMSDDWYKEQQKFFDQYKKIGQEIKNLNTEIEKTYTQSDILTDQIDNILQNDQNNNEIIRIIPETAKIIPKDWICITYHNKWK